jgi:hypothetical protein
MCGHPWESLEDETAQAIVTAAKANQQGPFCALCYHFEMAARYVMARDIRFLEAAAGFLERRAAWINRHGCFKGEPGSPISDPTGAGRGVEEANQK